MSRILFAWEVGSNFGHAAKIACLAQELPGHDIVIASRDVTTMRKFLGDVPARLLPVPLPPDLRAVRPGVSFADNLRKVGYNAPEVLGPLLDSWSALIDLIAPDIIICQSAPTALLAAQVWPAPVMNIGTGHDIPPMITPLPPFFHWTDDTRATAAAGEAEVLGIINRVFADRGRAPLNAMTDAFAADRTILATMPELDHYPPSLRSDQTYAGALFAAQVGADIAWVKPQRRIFAYLRQTGAASGSLISSLGAFAGDCDVVLASPGLDAAIGAQLREQGVRWIDGPVALEGLLDKATLCISHGSFGVVGAAMTASVAQVCLPTHSEQAMIGHAVARNGAGVALAKDTPAEAFRAVLAKALGDAPMHAAARSLGETIRARQKAPVAQSIAAQILEMLPAKSA